MKKLLPIFFLLALLLTPVSTVFAQGGNPPPPDPPVDSVVLDTLDWLSPTQEQEINDIVFELDREGLAQIAVVTLNDCGGDSELFRNQLFRDWGIGHADDNDGLLIMVCWYDGVQGQRVLEQEVGTGMEGTIPDLLTDRMFDQYFVPAFSQGKADSEVISSGEAGEALVSMVIAYDDVIRQEPQPTPLASEETKNPEGDSLWVVLFIVLVIFLAIAVVSGIIGSSSSSDDDDEDENDDTFLGGGFSDLGSSRGSDDDDDDDDSGGSFSGGGFPSIRPSSPSPNRSSGINFGGGTSRGGGSRGKF